MLKTCKETGIMEEKKAIRETVIRIAEKYGIEVDRIILFGSRARGDFKENSDWDILIVVKDKHDKKTLSSFWGRLIKIS